MNEQIIKNANSPSESQSMIGFLDGFLFRQIENYTLTKFKRSMEKLGVLMAKTV